MHKLINKQAQEEFINELLHKAERRPDESDVDIL